MKKIISFLICFCMIIGMFPAITLAENADWISSISSFGALAVPGTLIGDYSFTGGETPWKNVPNNFPADSQDYSVEYTSEGFKLTRLQDGTKDNNGTQYKDSNDSLVYGRLNFVKVLDEATKSYETGLKGTYVIDLTYKQNMLKPDSNTASTRPRLDMNFGYNDDITSYDNSSKANNIRFTSDPYFKLYDKSNNEYKDGGGTAKDGRNVDVVQRFVIDTDDGQIAHYNYIDGVYVYVGSGDFYGDSVQGMNFNPRLGFAKDSYFTYKSVKIYEVKKTADSKVIVDNRQPEEPGGSGGSGEGSGSTNTPDPNNSIPDWEEVISLLETPATKVSDYTFKDSDIPGERVEHAFGKNGYYTGEYTNEGFKVTKASELLTAPTSGKESSEWGRINFVLNSDSDTQNNTETYQYGMVGKYIVDVDVVFNFEAADVYTKDVHIDWAFRYDEDTTTVPSYFSSSVNCGIALCTKIKGTAVPKLTMHEGSSTSAPSIVVDGANTKLTKNKKNTLRFAVDTYNGTISQYIGDENGTFRYIGTSSNYSGGILQSLTFSPRQEFKKGTYLLFKGVRIYEIEKTVDTNLGDSDRNTEINKALNDSNTFPLFVATDPFAVSSDITLPAGEWKTSNDSIITATGEIKRSYDDQNVALYNSFKTVTAPVLQVVKYYNLNVLRRADIVDKVIADADFKAPGKEVIYSDKTNTEITSNGLKIKNGGNNIIVPLRRLVDFDTNSSTYVENLSGVYDFDVNVIPSVSKTFAEGGKPVSLEVGYYNAETGEFIPYVNVDMYKDVAKYYTNIVSAKDCGVTNGASNKYKLRVDTVNNQIWLYENGNVTKPLAYTGNEFVNAYRISVDENAEVSDNVIVENAKVTSLFDFDNAEFAYSDINTSADKAKGILMSHITEKPADAYGKMGDLPDTIDGYKVEWTADSDFVDLVEKYIYRTTTNQTITVTAKIYDESNADAYVIKEFIINVYGTSDPEILLESITSKLAAKFITNQNADGLITDIVLPDVVAGNSVTWESSHPDILSKKGVINKNKDISEPTKVTLTATVTNGVATVYKDIDFIVAKRGADVTLFTSSANIETPIKGVVTYEANLNGAATLKDSKGNKIITLNDTGVVKVVMDFDNSKVSVFKDGVLVSDYIDFEEAAEDFKTVESSNVSNEKVILDEYEVYAYNIEKFGLLDVLRKKYITGNVTFGTTTIGGAVVTWDYNNTGFFGNDGTYNAPDNITFFDIDFSITIPNGTGATYKETLNLIAIPKNNVFAGSTVTNQGTSVPAGAYQTNLMFDGNYADTMFRGSYNKSTTAIIVDMKNKQDINNLYIANRGLKSADIYVSEDNVNWTLVAQPVFDGTEEKNNVVFATQNVRYVKIENILYAGEYVDIYEIAGFAVYSSSDKSYMDILSIGMPADYVLTLSSVTLPTTGIYGSTFVWASSNPQVISTTGAISKPMFDTEVLLTVTSTNGNATSTKTFRYLIKGAQGGQGGTPVGGGGAGGAGGAGGTFMGDTSTSAFPETNVVQTPVESNKKMFNDVEESDWFYKYVLNLKNNGIVNGDNLNNFNPDNYVTREEFVKMIIIAAGYELVEDGNGFSDVKESDWFSTYVYTAKANGVVNGISANQFGVSRPISRQDMSVIISNIIDVEADISTNRDKFTDDGNISSYAYKSVYTMKALGIINGYETGSFNPYGQLTRAEAAKVISMVMDIIK